MGAVGEALVLAPSPQTRVVAVLVVLPPPRAGGGLEDFGTVLAASLSRGFGTVLAALVSFGCTGVCHVTSCRNLCIDDPQGWL